MAVSKQHFHPTHTRLGHTHPLLPEGSGERRVFHPKAGLEVDGLRTARGSTELCPQGLKS